MDDKVLDSIVAPTLMSLVEAVNRAGIKREDMVNIVSTPTEYIAFFYN